MASHAMALLSGKQFIDKGQSKFCDGVYKHSPKERFLEFPWLDDVMLSREIKHLSLNLKDDAVDIPVTVAIVLFGVE